MYVCVNSVFYHKVPGVVESSSSSPSSSPSSFSPPPSMMSPMLSTPKRDSCATSFYIIIYKIGKF